MRRSSTRAAASSSKRTAKRSSWCTAGRGDDARYGGCPLRRMRRTWLRPFPSPSMPGAEQLGTHGMEQPRVSGAVQLVADELAAIRQPTAEPEAREQLIRPFVVAAARTGAKVTVTASAKRTTGNPSRAGYWARVQRAICMVALSPDGRLRRRRSVEVSPQDPAICAGAAWARGAAGSPPWLGSTAMVMAGCDRRHP